MRILDDDDDDEDDQGDDDDVADCRHAGADQIPGRRQVATCVTPSLVSYIHSYFTHFTLTHICFTIFYNILHKLIFHTFTLTYFTLTSMFYNILKYLTFTYISHILLPLTYVLQYLTSTDDILHISLDDMFCIIFR